MLAYLDALCAALLARNAIEIFRLLGLPDAKKLPRGVREEAVTIAKAGPDGFHAPIHALHLYYKLSHLVDESTELDPVTESTGPFEPQMEIPFRTRKVS
jgi:hypothetical protein